MRNIRLLLQYDGTDYRGFQIQPHVPTIQGEVERALERVLGHPVRIKGASRTDAGVHALGNVIAFGTLSPIPVERLVRATNAALPAAVSVVVGDEVGEQFHPRYDAVSKLYLYRILNRETPSPFIGRYAWHVPATLDIEAMRHAAAQLLGRHDFSAFENAGSDVVDKVRNLQRLDLVREGDVLEVRAEADGFLYMMVRNIVGTLLQVGRGQRSPDEVGEILRRGDRSLAGPTAPAQGLCLVRVTY